MKREFIINIILLVTINFLIKPLYIFGIDTRIQNLVGTESYGMYFSYFNFVFLFQFINDPGIQNWNAQFVPKNRKKLGLHLPNLILLKVLLAVIFVITTCISAWITGFNDVHIVFFLCLNIILSTFFLILRGIISGLGYYRTDSLLSSLDKLLMIIILGYLAWMSPYQNNFEISALIYGQGVSYFLAIIVAGVFIYCKTVLVFRGLSFTYLKGIIKNSLPYVLILIFMSAYNKIDGVMLGRLLDDNNYQAGVYASAYRIYDAANMIGYLFAAILLPMFAAHIHEKNVLEELKNVSLRYVVVSACMIVFSIFCYGNDILVLMYKDFEPSFLLSLKILISGYFMVAVAYIFGTLLVASGKVRNLNILFGAGLVINFLLNAALIPAYMASGAAVATLITQTFVMIGQIFLVKKELDISIRTKEIQLLGSFILASGLVFLVLYYIIPCQWYCKLAISILICLLLCLILKIIDKTEIRNLLMTKK